MPLKAKRIDDKLKSLPKAKGAFIKPMLLLRTEALPEGAAWLYELKLEGYRALAIKTVAQVQLRSRNDNDISVRYPATSRRLNFCRTRLSSMGRWSRSMNPGVRR